jgi:4-amino-4-deoxy-L-arabinose transferase-like glycosyltransferase
LSISKEFWAVLAIALIGATVTSLVGMRSDVSLGDEVYHFYMAKRWVEGGHRPTEEFQIHANPLARRKYTAMPLWHAGLAAIWSVTGIRQDVAQVYQGAWYVAFVLVMYDLGRRLYRRRVGFWTALLAATMPFIAVFTSLLYVDVAATTLSTLVLSCLVRRWFLRAGVVLGLAFLAKQNTYFLVPPIILSILLLARGTFGRRLAWAIGCLALAAVLHAPELAWGYYNLGSMSHRHPGVQALQPSQASPTAGPVMAAGEEAAPVKEVSYRFVHPSDFIRDPKMLVRYLGIPLWAGLALSLGRGTVDLRRRFKQGAKAWCRPTRGWILWLWVLMYIPPFAYFFHGFYGVRYLAPIMPMLCVISAHSLFTLRTRWAWVVALGVLVMGAGQFAAAETFLYEQRRLKPDMIEAYQWVVQNTEPNAGLLCQNTVLTPMTRRRAMWSSEASLPEIGYLLWEANEKEACHILRRYAVDYIFVERARIYDDSTEHRLPDWPQSFVTKLEGWPSMKLVFRNNAAAIWRLPKTAPPTSPSLTPEDP